MSPQALLGDIFLGEKVSFWIKRHIKSKYIKIRYANWYFMENLISIRHFLDVDQLYVIGLIFNEWNQQYKDWELAWGNFKPFLMPSWTETDQKHTSYPRCKLNITRTIKILGLANIYLTDNLYTHTDYWYQVGQCQYIGIGLTPRRVIKKYTTNFG